MRWLTLIGIGDNGLDSLTPEAVKWLEAAEKVIAPERVLAQLSLEDKIVQPWTGRFHEMVESIVANRGVPVTILATGDPMHYGIGATLSRHFSMDEMRILPFSSAFSLAACRLGWALQNVSCISLHGRSVERLGAYLQPERRILALTSNQQTIFEVGEYLEKAGFSQSHITILEHMGGVRERQVKTSVSDLAKHKWADFNTLAIDCVADGEWYANSAGLPDNAYIHDGQITKQEVRASTIGALKPYPCAVLWDVGAGCGSVAIEWTRAIYGARAVAIESHAQRCQNIAANAAKLGGAEIKIIEGKAPQCLMDLPQPDAIFIGGGLTNKGMFDACWAALKPNGRLVANAVTLESEACLAALHAQHGGRLVRMQISQASAVGPYRGWRPSMPVTQWSVDKPVIANKS